MLYKYIKCTRELFEAFFKFSLLYFSGVFNKTIIPLALVGYEMIIANSALCPSLAIYHLISNDIQPSHHKPCKCHIDCVSDCILYGVV